MGFPAENFMTIHDGAMIFDTIIQGDLTTRVYVFSIGDFNLLAYLIADHCDGRAIQTDNREHKQLLIKFDAPFSFPVLTSKNETEKNDFFLDMGKSTKDMPC